MGSSLNLSLFLYGHYCAASPVVAVFQGYKPGPGQVAQVRLNGLRYLFSIRKAFGSIQDAGEHSRQRCHGSHFVVKYMAVGIAHDLFTGLCVDSNGNLVAHAPGRYEKGGFDFSSLDEVAELEVEEDYQICVRRS